MTKRIVVVDADSIVWASCAVLDEGEPVNFALHNIKTQLTRIREETEADEMVVYIGGKGNFRHDLYDEYKANRKQEKPQYFEEAREYIISRWKAITCDGMEADDAVGIYNYKWKDKYHVVMAHIDKDLDMLEGHHYNFRTSESYYIDEVQGYRKFYTQMLTGDTSDNIPGLFKFTGKKATAKIKAPIEEMTTKEEMHEYVKDVYVQCFRQRMEEHEGGGEARDSHPGREGDAGDGDESEGADGMGGDVPSSPEGETSRHLNLIGKLLWIKRS
jgi:hypothetical protein